MLPWMVVYTARPVLGALHTSHCRDAAATTTPRYLLIRSEGYCLALSHNCLQCSDTVGWAAGRASGLQKNGAWWRWALVSSDVVVPSLMVCVSASVNLPLHHEVQKFSSGTGSPGWSRKKGRKTVVGCGLSHNR